MAAWTKNTLQDHFFKEAKKQGVCRQSAQAREHAQQG